MVEDAIITGTAENADCRAVCCQNSEFIVPAAQAGPERRISRHRDLFSLGAANDGHQRFHVFADLNGGLIQSAVELQCPGSVVDQVVIIRSTGDGQGGLNALGDFKVVVAGSEISDNPCHAPEGLSATKRFDTKNLAWSVIIFIEITNNVPLVRLALRFIAVTGSRTDVEIENTSIEGHAVCVIGIAAKEHRPRDLHVEEIEGRTDGKTEFPERNSDAWGDVDAAR